MYYANPYLTASNAKDVAEWMKVYFEQGSTYEVTLKEDDFWTGQVKTSKEVFRNPSAILSWEQSYPLILFTAHALFFGQHNMGRSITSHAPTAPKGPADGSQLGVPLVNIFGTYMRIIAPDYRGKRITLEFICLDPKEDN